MGLAEHFNKAGISAPYFGKGTVSVMRSIARGSAYVIDVVKGIGLAGETMLLGFKVIGAGIERTIIGLMDLAAKLPSSLGGDTFKGIATVMHEDFDRHWSELQQDRDRLRQSWKDLFDHPTVNAVDTFFRSVAEKAEAVRKAAAKAPGGDQDFTRLFQLFERGQKVTNDMLVPMEKLEERLNELNELVEAGAISWETWTRAAGKAIMEANKPNEFLLGTETHFEKLSNRIDELNNLLDVGAIKWETYERAIAKSVQEMIGAEKLERRMTGAAEFGSQDAYKAINHTLLNPPRSKEEQLRDAIKQEQEIMKKQLKETQEIARAARKGFLAVGRI